MIRGLGPRGLGMLLVAKEDAQSNAAGWYCDSMQVTFPCLEAQWTFQPLVLKKTMSSSLYVKPFGPSQRTSNLEAFRSNETPDAQ